MNPISPQNQERIRRLLGGGFWSTFFLSAPEQIELLQQIGFSTETAIIPEIAGLLVDTHGPVWRATAEAVHRLMEMLSPLELATLDYRVRQAQCVYEAAQERWSKLRPSRVAHFAESEFAVTLCGLASFHANGFVREQAIEGLRRIKEGTELPFLLIRMNDWVPSVRDLALQAVRERLTPEYGSHFLNSLRLVLRLETRNRSDQGLVEEIHALLRRPECRSVLQTGMASQDRCLRQASYQLALDQREPDRIAFIKTAVADLDPIVRAWAVRRFLSEVPDADLLEIVKHLLQDRFMPVRRDALWMLATRLSELANEPLRSALLDASAAVRETARHFQAKAECDLCAFYRAALTETNPKKRPYAIRGLGEIGQPSDARLIRPFLCAPEPQLRKAALFALGKLDAEGSGPEFLRALADNHPGVSREAVRACFPKARCLNLGDLWQLYQKDGRSYVRKHILMLLQRFGKWERLAPVLMACGDVDPAIAAMAKGGVRKWIATYNSSYAQPTPMQIQQIRLILDQCVNLLDKHVLKELDSCLSTFEK